MTWTEITRPKYRRDGLRYASDTTDAEWAVISRHLPGPCRRGRPRRIALREVVNAIFYIGQTGCQWRLLPKDLPAFTRRWVVERLIASLNRNRRLAKDFEATIESAVAWLFVASVKMLVRQVARA